MGSDEHHLNTGPQTPEPESAGEEEVGEDELMDEDDLVEGTVSAVDARTAEYSGTDASFAGEADTIGQKKKRPSFG